MHGAGEYRIFVNSGTSLVVIILAWLIDILRRYRPKEIVTSDNVLGIKLVPYTGPVLSLLTLRVLGDTLQTTTWTRHQSIEPLKKKPLWKEEIGASQ